MQKNHNVFSSVKRKTVLFVRYLENVKMNQPNQLYHIFQKIKEKSKFLRISSKC